jgi:hypothetical protein
MTTRHWKDIRPGWYEHVIKLDENRRKEHRIEVIDWLCNKIENYERHTLCTWDEFEVRIKFRYQRDYIFCSLRW